MKHSKILWTFRRFYDYEDILFSLNDLNTLCEKHSIASIRLWSPLSSLKKALIQKSETFKKLNDYTVKNNVLNKKCFWYLVIENKRKTFSEIYEHNESRIYHIFGKKNDIYCLFKELSVKQIMES